MISGKAKAKLANAARLGKADGGSGGVAHAMDGGFGQLADADDEEPFGGQTGRCMQQDRLIGPGLVLACRKHGGSGRLNGGVGNEQRGLGVGVWAPGSLRVGGQNGQQFSPNA